MYPGIWSLAAVAPRGGPGTWMGIACFSELKMCLPISNVSRCLDSDEEGKIKICRGRREVWEGQAKRLASNQ